MKKGECTGDFIRCLHVGPTGQATVIAIVLFDTFANCVHMRFMSEWAGFNARDLKMISAFSANLRLKAKRLEPSALFRSIRASPSLGVWTTDPQILYFEDANVELEKLEKELLGRVLTPESTRLLCRHQVSPWRRIPTQAFLSVKRVRCGLKNVGDWVMRRQVRYGAASAMVTSAVMISCFYYLPSETGLPQGHFTTAQAKSLARSDTDGPVALVCLESVQQRSIPNKSKRTGKARKPRVHDRNEYTLIKKWAVPMAEKAEAPIASMLAAEPLTLNSNELTAPLFDDALLSRMTKHPPHRNSMRGLLRAIISPLLRIATGLKHE